MRFTWFGHAAFLIEGITDAGDPVRILTDPYKSPDIGGFEPISISVDLVTLSHENPVFHSDRSSLHGEFEEIWGLNLPSEGVTARGVPIRALRVYENEARDPEGANAMIRFTLEGLTVSHLGDLGHALNREELEFLRGTDVLLALAGGPPTIALTDLKALIEELNIPLVLPMHYALPGLRLNLRPVDDFLALFPPEQVQRPGSRRLEVTRDALPAQSKIVVLDALRLS